FDTQDAVNFIGDGCNIPRCRPRRVDEAWRRTPERRLRVDNTVRHLALKQRKSRLRKLSANVFGNHRLARCLGQKAAEDRMPAADAVDEYVERVQHSVDVEWGRLDGNQNEIAHGEACQRGLRAEAGGIDDDWTAGGGETAGRLPRVLACILDHSDASECTLTVRQSSDRALRISVNDGWAATFE